MIIRKGKGKGYTSIYFREVRFRTLATSFASNAFIDFTRCWQ